jgi:lysostaphin
MLFAILSSLFVTCVPQGGIQSYWPGPHDVAAAEIQPGPSLLITKAWQHLATQSWQNTTNNDTDTDSQTTNVPGRYPQRLNVELPPTASLPAPNTTLTNTQYYVAETGHYINAPFLNYWRNTGANDVFGYPLSEAFDQNGQLVQLFDQALMVYHPELKGQKGEVQLGSLGQILAEAQGLTASTAFAPLPPTIDTADQRYFTDTKHTISNAFKSFWEKNNLLKFLGLPLSQEIANPDGLTVQYFERGRLEYNPATQQVNYSNSGDLLLAAQGWPRPTKFSLALNFSPKIDLGRTLALRLWNEDGVQPSDMQATFGDTSLKFGQVGPILKAFEAISPSLQPAPMQLQLNFSDAAGRARQFSQPITVTNHDFGTQDLELTPDQAYLADHAADDYDDAKLADVYNAYTPQLLWSGKWQWPLKLDWTLTTNFAQRRTINGKPDTLYYHGGLDMAPNSGQEGGPIYAPATGKVVYIGMLQARGNTIALDHGLGVTSYYFHLSRTDVKVGQLVQPGDLLGAIGTTGRATGPHLHWEVRVNGIITDPRTFIEQDLSK